MRNNAKDKPLVPACVDYGDIYFAHQFWCLSGAAKSRSVVSNHLHLKQQLIWTPLQYARPMSCSHSCPSPVENSAEYGNIYHHHLWMPILILQFVSLQLRSGSATSRLYVPFTLQQMAFAPFFYDANHMFNFPFFEEYMRSTRLWRIQFTIGLSIISFKVPKNIDHAYLCTLSLCPQN